MKTYIPICLLPFYACMVHAETPQQAQASALVVPVPKEFASAVVVTQCKQAVAAVLVDRQGNLHPLHLKDSTQAMLLTQLSQAETVTEIEVTCPDSRPI